jgi:glutathione S-transferase
MKAKITLYSFRRCPFAMRVRMTLHEKRIPFHTIQEDLKNLSEDLRKLHPEAKVPLLIDGDRVIYESAVITEYIDEAYPATPLMPEEAGERCEVRLWTYWCNHFFKINVDQYKYGVSRFSKEECIGCAERLQDQLSKIEMRLRDHDWLVGNRISLADIHVFPFVRQLWRVIPTPTFLIDFSSTKKWLDALQERPSFVRTMEKQIQISQDSATS